MGCIATHSSCRLCQTGDEAWEEVQYPVTHRLLEKFDAVLRVKGASKGADEYVKVAREKGLKIYYNLEDIPNAE